MVLGHHVGIRAGVATGIKVNRDLGQPGHGVKEAVANVLGDRMRVA